MYTTIRYFYPNGMESESMDNTIIEHKTFEKAEAYCFRYSKGSRFAGVEIYDENDNLVWELTSDQEVSDYREETIKEQNSEQLEEMEISNESTSREFTMNFIKKYGSPNRIVEPHIGQIVRLSDGTKAEITGGKYWGSYNRISNFWYWNVLNDNEDVVGSDHGYGEFYEL